MSLLSRLFRKRSQPPTVGGLPALLRWLLSSRGKEPLDLQQSVSENDLPWQAATLSVTEMYSDRGHPLISVLQSVDQKDQASAQPLRNALHALDRLQGLPAVFCENELTPLLREWECRDQGQALVLEKRLRSSHLMRIAQATAEYWLLVDDLFLQQANRRLRDDQERKKLGDRLQQVQENGAGNSEPRCLNIPMTEEWPLASLLVPWRVDVSETTCFAHPVRVCSEDAAATGINEDAFVALALFNWGTTQFSLLYCLPGTSVDQARARFGTGLSVLLKKIAADCAGNLSRFSKHPVQLKKISAARRPTAARLVAFTYRLAWQGQTLLFRLLFNPGEVLPLFCDQETGPACSLLQSLVVCNGGLLTTTLPDWEDQRCKQGLFMAAWGKPQSRQTLLVHQFLALLGRRDLIRMLEGFVALGNPLWHIKSFCYRPSRDGEPIPLPDFHGERFAALMPPNWQENYRRMDFPLVEDSQFLNRNRTLFRDWLNLWEEGRLALSSHAAGLLRSQFSGSLEEQARKQFLALCHGARIQQLFETLNAREKDLLRCRTTADWFREALMGENQVIERVTPLLSRTNRTIFLEDLAWIRRQLQNNTISFRRLVASKKRLIQELEQIIERRNQFQAQWYGQ